MKDSGTGPFVDEWKKVFPSEVEGVEQVDASTAFSTVMAVKDETELVGFPPLDCSETDPGN